MLRQLLVYPLLLCCAGLVAQAQGSQPVARTEDKALEATLRQLQAGFAGHLDLYAEDLHSGRFVALDANEVVPTASVIKLAILYEGLLQIRAGQASWGEPLTLTKANQTAGSGVLLFFDTPATLTLRDVLTLMIAESDNTAANVAMDALGIANVDAAMALIGLPNTYLYKKIGVPAAGSMPADQPRFGLGKTTPREMASLLARFVDCDLGPGPRAAAAPSDGALCTEALNMLSDQFFRDGLPRYLEGTGVRIANKTGSLEHVRNDVGVVWAANGPVVLSLFTYGDEDTRWTAENGAELLLAQLSQEIVDTWH